MKRFSCFKCGFFDSCQGGSRYLLRSDSKKFHDPLNISCLKYQTRGVHGFLCPNFSQ
eukprot:UN12352